MENFVLSGWVSKAWKRNRHPESWAGSPRPTRPSARVESRLKPRMLSVEWYLPRASQVRGHLTQDIVFCRHYWKIRTGNGIVSELEHPGTRSLAAQIWFFCQTWPSFPNLPQGRGVNHLFMTPGLWAAYHNSLVSLIYFLKSKNPTVKKIK
jgi:hypothetical protein